MIGGGGAGGGNNYGACDHYGGNSGFWIIKHPYTVTPSTEYDVVVGAGGTAPAHAGNGGAGGDTSFDSITVLGGTGGIGFATGSGAGVIPTRTPGISKTGLVTEGGSSNFGIGGIATGGYTGTAPVGYGAGGYSNDTAGLGGTQGVCIIEW